MIVLGCKHQTKVNHHNESGKIGVTGPQGKIISIASVGYWCALFKLILSGEYLKG